MAQNPETIMMLCFETDENSHNVQFPCTLTMDDPTMEYVSVKRLKCVEKESVYPYISLSMIRGSRRNVVRNVSNDECNKLTGIYECIQCICNGSSIRQVEKKGSVSDDGYLIFSYKTMEDMCTSGFAFSWKTWTGARFLSRLLPEHLVIKRLSFFKKLGSFDGFTDCAPALNVLHCIRPRICAVLAAYREVPFKIHNALCRSLYMPPEQHQNAYTSHLKVHYSNNTVNAEFPEFFEFRCESDSEDGEQGNSRMVSEETQTMPIEIERRRLPRTISIYDFPSILNSNNEFVCPRKDDNANIETLELGLEEDIELKHLNSLQTCECGRRRSQSSGSEQVRDKINHNTTNNNNNNNRNLLIRAKNKSEDLETSMIGERRCGSPWPRSPTERGRTKEISVRRSSSARNSRQPLLDRLMQNYFNSPNYSREELLEGW